MVEDPGYLEEKGGAKWKRGLETMDSKWNSAKNDSSSQFWL